MDAYGVGITGLANATEIIGQELNAEFIRDWHKHFLVIVQKNQFLGRLKILRRVTISNSIFAIKALLLGVGGLLHHIQNIQQTGVGSLLGLDRLAGVITNG